MGLAKDAAIYVAAVVKLSRRAAKSAINRSGAANNGASLAH
jgi:hypothetical protein